MAAELPKGWEGSFEVERGNSAVDDFIAAAENQFYAGNGRVPTGTLYQYVTETDGITSTYQYDSVVFKLVERRRSGRAMPASSRSSSSSPPGASASDDSVRDHHRRRVAAAERDGCGGAPARRCGAYGPGQAAAVQGGGSGAVRRTGPWLGMAMLACSVAAIDDIPVPPPVNEQQIEALVSRLGDRRHRRGRRRAGRRRRAPRSRRWWQDAGN